VDYAFVLGVPASKHNLLLHVDSAGPRCSALA
jgi:hypothetical protein